MKRLYLLPFLFLHLALSAQQYVAVISRCGGVDTVVVPTLVDNDHDGMDDRLEQKLLNTFMPSIIQFSDESCPGPALDGTGDSNLIVSRIYPLPQQYTRSTSFDSVLVHPVPVVPAHGLHAGLVWYNPLIIAKCAVLYGQDCGLLGHTADVEGFSFSLKYIGPDTAAGWMYDTVMTHWMGGTIQTVSHAGTPCEQVETKPYRSALFPNGVDSVLASPDKHGNYLTVGGCGQSFICNPGCGNTMSKKHVKPVNIGEPNASLVPDLGAYYAAYAGENPWSTSNFLATEGGNAGPVSDKMTETPSSAFFSPQTLTAPQICPLYVQCYGLPGSSQSQLICQGDSFGFFGIQLRQSGIYAHTLSDMYGCDSTVSLTLSVLKPDTTVYSVNICSGSSTNFNGAQLSMPGVYYAHFNNRFGCDSAIALNLAVNPLIVYNYAANICPGDTYDFNGRPLNISGSYADTTVTNVGCDSIVRLALTVNGLPFVSWPQPTQFVSLTAGPFALSGAQPAGGTYSGDGVNGNYFYPDSAGIGSHTITYSFIDSNGCSNSVTRQFIVQVTGLDKLDYADGLNIYPNPVKHLLIVELKEPVNEHITITLLNTAGQKVEITHRQVSQKLIFDTGNLSTGVYYLLISTDDKHYATRFIKQ